MMKSKFLIIFMLGLLCCDDISDPDLTKDSVVVRLPADNASIASTSATFWWEPLPGATGYSLKIVSPDPVNPIELVVDTTVTSNTFKINLDLGKYGWCVRAINASYQSKEICRSFELTPP